MPAPTPTTDRPPTAPDGPTGRLATWLADTTLDRIPAQVRERAAHLVLDGLGCALIGAQLPWSRTAAEAVLAMEGAGETPVIGWGRTTSAPAAAVLNGTFIQGFELDDYFPRAPLHSASLVLPALLSTASHTAAVSGADFLRAAVLGFEVGPRVGFALNGPEMLARGWHSGSVFGTHAAAAAAAALRGLDAAGFEDALGLAGTQSAGLMAAQYEAMSKRMHHGFASRNGYYAAGLAEAGYTGIKRVFERPYGGFLATFGEGHHPDAAQITKDLGVVWNTEKITVKIHAAMGGLHPAIDAALALAAEHHLSADSVERIRIDIPEAIYHHGWWVPERPLTTIGAQMNIGYAVAVALLDGHVRPEQFHDARIDADDTWKLIARTEVHLDNDTKDPAWPEPGYNTRVTLTVRGGTTVARSLNQPHGGPDDPLTNAEIRDKYRALTARVIDPARSAEIERLVLDLEAQDSITDLVDLLAAPVRGALD
ncbi:MmgE/PrpD family protein [Streptomyces davaonensis JCM 4913]|uniref:MmgE/PrpD family protein n=1 Tax=Streptomyces davaonensis (strain DSM 101723 / JCM 4913 / KCC S-0913 / 768) TaxID=1214101 RepID=K4QSP7_STRDJ|nr:MmgE/PrpD family protein [Streptomyces davaonensis]CCK25021.1 MmgE/PrpD family protein [Streptomyces davaonensis JCM 4913]